MKSLPSAPGQRLAAFATTRVPALRKLSVRQAIEGYICISPWLIGFVIFTLGPMLASAVLSLTDYSVVKSPRFVGLTNYFTIFAQPTFWISVKNTVYFTVIYVPISLAGSLGCALLLNQPIKGRLFFRSIYYLPSITPAVATAYLWLWLLQPRVGLINHLLQLVGIQGPAWVGSPLWSKPALILMALWAAIGGNTMLIFLSALQGVPVELQEAAGIDGAGTMQRFRHITLPMISPTLFFTSIMGLIAGLQVFNLAYIVGSGGGFTMEMGGPAYSTLFYVLNLYMRAFQYWDMGVGSAMAWVFFVVVLLLTLFQVRMSRMWVYYEGKTEEKQW